MAVATPTIFPVPSVAARVVLRAENEENTKWFAENYPQFEVEWEKQIFPGRETDGFFIAKFNRRSL